MPSCARRHHLPRRLRRHCPVEFGEGVGSAWRALRNVRELTLDILRAVPQGGVLCLP